MFPACLLCVLSSSGHRAAPRRPALEMQVVWPTAKLFCASSLYLCLKEDEEASSRVKMGTQGPHHYLSAGCSRVGSSGALQQHGEPAAGAVWREFPER